MNQNLAVGKQCALNAGSLPARDDIERGRRGAGLVEPNGMALPDVECVPVDDGAIGTLIDREGIAVRLGDDRLSGSDRAAGGKILRKGRGAERGQNKRERERERESLHFPGCQSKGYSSFFS